MSSDARTRWAVHIDDVAHTESQVSVSGSRFAPTLVTTFATTFEYFCVTHEPLRVKRFAGVCSKAGDMAQTVAMSVGPHSSNGSRQSRSIDVHNKIPLNPHPHINWTGMPTRGGRIRTYGHCHRSWYVPSFRTHTHGLHDSHGFVRNTQKRHAATRA